MLNRFLKILSIAIFFLAPSFIYAASLSFLPSTTSVNVGSTFSVRVALNSAGVSVNNGEAVIQFPKDLVEVVSINRNSSIFSLWVEEPSFSNNTGVIYFNGGAANPGYTGTSGSIASITFRAKREGSASLVFSSAAVRQNDGLGTDVLTAKNPITIQIKTPPVAPVKETPLPVKEKEVKVEPAVPKTDFIEIFTAPEINLSSQEILKGDSVIVSGTTDYPGKQIQVILESNGKEIKRYLQTTSTDGSYFVTTDSINTTGALSVWAEIIIKDLQKSKPSEKLYLKVNDNGLIEKSLVIEGLIIISILFGILVFFLCMGWYKFFHLKKRVHNLEKLLKSSAKK